MITMVYYRRNLLVLSLTTFLATCSWNQVVPFLPLFIKELGVNSKLVFWMGMTLVDQTVDVIGVLLY
jgi:hypothetical protein